MKSESRPWWYLAILVDIVLWAWIFASAGCAHYPRPAGTPRANAEMARTAVAVKTECGWGSGVLLDDRRVLTAHHVIDCDRTDKVRLATTVKVQLSDGAVLVATYDALDATRDLARLRLPSAVEHVRPLTVARTMPGQVVCAVTAVPAREFHCGLVGDLKRSRDQGDVYIRGAQLWFGNSGSALYSTDGALVGIVVRTYFCDPLDQLLWEWFELRPARMCGGRASSVEGPVSL